MRFRRLLPCSCPADIRCSSTSRSGVSTDFSVPRATTPRARRSTRSKLLGLPYPGGRYVEELARGGDPKRFQFGRPMLRRNALPADEDYYAFSFSGLKTA